jgi:ribosomal protein S18 acetylase RimI-like enzyme
MTNGNGLAIRQPTAADAPACDEVVRSLPYHFEASSEITWMAVHAGHRDRGVGRTLIRRLTGQLRAQGRRLLLAMPLDAQAAAADGTTVGP